MADDASLNGRNTSGYYPFFQNLFDAVDVASTFWQPLLKAFGRTQLELASLQTQQAQAVLHWTQRAMQPCAPTDLVNANAQLWLAMTERCMSALPRLVAAAATASGAVAPIMLPVPAKRRRDTLILLDRDEVAAGALERKVA